MLTSGNTKLLIVNADDFGLAPSVNAGIIRAYEHGIVTSTSLMVRWTAAEDAATYARHNPHLSTGLHLDLGEWVPQDGDTWSPLYTVISTDDDLEVRAECQRQLDHFRRLLGKDPTHLDSHQHVHLHEPVRSVAVDMARRLQIPLRDCTQRVHYCGDFYGQSEDGMSFPELVSVDALREILTSLAPGVTEIGCHPGLDGALDSPYARERLLEVEALCDPGVRDVLDVCVIKLESYLTLGTPMPESMDR